MTSYWNRPSKANGAGFYDYPTNNPKHLWPKLSDLYYNADFQISLQDIKDRLLFIQAIETLTGRALQLINQYGISNFVTRTCTPAKHYGDRFTPPKLLLNMAETADIFRDE